MRRFTSFGPAFVVLITVLVTLLAAPAAVRRISFANTQARITLARAELDPDDILERINAAVRNIAKSVEPSVVHIQWDFQRARGARSVMVAQGSGWVYDGAGHIVTNAHVVSGAPGLVVQLYDGRRVPADVIGVDQSTDIAVIKVRTSEGLFPASRATGVDVSQGDRVYAFGSPFGFKFSMSEGIVSGLGRDPRAVIDAAPGGGYTNFIQTDAAVNPGNSGGPLVDIKGRVVGMNVAIATGRSPQGEPESGQSSGISFAIPLATIESVVDQLISQGSVARGYLGINHGDSASQAIARSRMNYVGPGVVVIGVEPGGPADQAGLHANDIILEFAGKPVADLPVLRSLISVNRPGQKTTMKVWRQGQTLELPVTLANQSATEVGMMDAAVAARQFGLVAAEESDEGLVIKGVIEGSQAQSAGLAPGLVITRVNDRRIQSTNDLLLSLAELGFANGRRLTITVMDPRGQSADLPIQYRP